MVNLMFYELERQKKKMWIISLHIVKHIHTIKCDHEAVAKRKLIIINFMLF